MAPAALPGLGAGHGGGRRERVSQRRCHEAAAGPGGVCRLTAPPPSREAASSRQPPAPVSASCPAVVPAPRTRAPGPPTRRYDRGRRLQLGADHEHSEQHSRGQCPDHALLLQTGESAGRGRRPLPPPRAQGWVGALRPGVCRRHPELSFGAGSTSRTFSNFRQSDRCSEAK